MPKTEGKIIWLAAPEDHNYPAAVDYLSLLHGPDRAAELGALLRAAEVVVHKAKDIFRASGLGLLGVSNSHVAKDQKKIAKGVALSPILLVRDNGRLVIADGYHRLCAVYSFDEDAGIPCKIV